MNDVATSPTPMRHWLISGAGLIWNLFGLLIFISTVTATPEQLAAQYNAVEIAFIESIPWWATGANAIAVLAAVAACIMLLLRKALALPLFFVSLAAIVVQDLHAFVVEDSVAVFGMVPLYIQGTVFVIAILLTLYTRGAIKNGRLT